MKFRKVLKRVLKPVSFSELDRVEPVSNQFGFDRGTPIDRHYIQQYLTDKSSEVKGIGCEIAEDHYLSLFGDKLTKKEIFDFNQNNPTATQIGDLTVLSSLKEASVDTFICTQTFNFIYDFKTAIAGAKYMLKPNGVLLATVAGICQISRYDMDNWGDYWRFTSLSARKSFEEVFGKGNVEVTAFGNVAGCMSFLQGLSVEDLPNKNILESHDPNYELLIGITARNRT